MKWGLAPSSIMLGRKKKQRYFEHYDYALAVAMEILDDEKCPKCGLPAWHAYSENNAIGFELDHITCHSCEFKELEEKKNKDEDHPGRTVFVKAYSEVEGEPLPGRRDFQEEVIRKAEKKLLSKTE